MKYKICPADDCLEEVKRLVVDYSKELNRDLSFQGFDNELLNLKEKYTYPNGKIICCKTENDKVIGCVAYKKHSDIRCELKRLYVMPEYRKFGIGKKLLESIVEEAKKDNYKEIVLDTIKPLQSAIKLYKKYGFKEIMSYYDNPLEDVIYMKLDL